MSSISPAIAPSRVRVATIVVASLSGFLAGELLALLFEVVGASLAHFPGGFRALAKVADPPWWANALGLVGLWIGFAGASVVSYRDGGLGPLRPWWRVRVSDLGFVVLGVACQLLVDVAYRPFHSKTLNHPVDHLFKATHGAGFVVLAIFTTFLAPFFEEWFFRGVIYRALAESALHVSSRTKAVMAVVVSAAIFGLAHGELVQFVGLFALGVVLALVVKKTQRLTPSYVTHASFNAVALVAVISQRAGH